ncbi:MAG: MarR family transcriptional regulator [Pseudoflavonifractor sp.]|nr:MarR family transcriptional regulator [Pseudoflavonifractor sp.]MDY3020010.1 MarR family transcriptional regulator [Oscillospiraceae bacterium]
MDGFYNEVEQRIVRIFNTYMEMQRRQHEYCPGILLYPSEIHAIECIALTNPINITELARALGMTKGGISKCVVKLEKLGLVRRYKYIRNQKEVYLHLTGAGVDAFHGHEQYHAGMDRAMAAYGDQLCQEQGEEILKFLDIYSEQMNGLLEQSVEPARHKKGE